MLGYGSADFSQGTYGKGVMQASAKMPASVTVQSASLAEWSATGWVNATADPGVFGGLTLGAFSQITATSDMIGVDPSVIWASSTTYLTTPKFTFDASGKIAWDSQLVGDTTWTSEIVD